MIAFAFPLKVTSALNGRLHWAAKAEMVKRQRSAARFVSAYEIRRAGYAALGLAPLVKSVVVTRVGPSAIKDKHDNLPGALKHVVDGIADALLTDDSKLTWRYRQRTGEYAVEIEIHFKGGST